MYWFCVATCLLYHAYSALCIVIIQYVFSVELQYFTLTQCQTLHKSPQVVETESLVSSETELHVCQDPHVFVSVTLFSLLALPLSSSLSRMAEITAAW